MALYSEESDLKFLRTTFQKLSYTIEYTLEDQYI